MTGFVAMGCKPGPATILSDEEEDLLCEYIINIADMGYGLTREDVQRLACKIAKRLAVNICLKMERLDVDGLMASKLVTLSYLSVPHNLFHLPGLFQQMNIWFVIFLQNSGAFMAG